MRGWQGNCGAGQGTHRPARPRCRREPVSQLPWGGERLRYCPRTTRTTRTAASGSDNETFDARFLRASEVHQEAELQAGGPEVVQHLSPVFRGELAQRLQFYDDEAEADEVGLVG